MLPSAMPARITSLEAALDAAALAADAAAAGRRQVAPLVDEDLDVVALDLVGREMRGDQARELLERRAGIAATISSALSTNPSTPFSHTSWSAASLDGK